MTEQHTGDQPRRDERMRRRSLDSLKKEAKRWLDALRHNVGDARVRFERAIPKAPAEPSLRDVQHALAIEHGFGGWSALKQQLLSNDSAVVASLAQYQYMAETLVEAYRTGAPDVMERLYQFAGHRREWRAMRTYVQLDLGKRPGEDVEITIDDARYIVAKGHDYENWDALVQFVTSSASSGPMTPKPVRVISSTGGESDDAANSSRDWHTVMQWLSVPGAMGLDAHGEMTDALLEELSELDHLTTLRLGDSRALTDEGVQLLARMPQLRHLDLSMTAVTDEGLSVLRELPHLETISLAWTHVTDAGVAMLSGCEALTQVNLSGTRCGDGAIRALTGKAKLSHFQSGSRVTNAGLPYLHEFPVFKQWQGGDVRMALLSYDTEPNRLQLRGTFTDDGMTALRGLDGLFGLNLDDSNLPLTGAALAPLVSLPRLGWLAFDAKDDAMPFIAAMPRLRFLGCQDTPASDDGWVALSRSQSLEQIWGRRCYNLQSRGFLALSTMPALRGLSVSCKNVDDTGLAALPNFPSLRELMPMDIPDAGYRHIGRCSNLESLVLMYCRDTGDEATEHITGLSRLARYFASYNLITDRTPELLSHMDSLERVSFDKCAAVTNAGVAALARLPRLRDLSVSGQRITPEVKAAFGPGVTVHYFQ